MATPVPKRRGNNWTVLVDLPCGPGERKQKRITCRTKSEVETLRDELIAQICSGTYIQPSKQPLEEYLLSWIDGYDAAERTLESYEEIISKHIIPALGSRTLSDLMPYHIQEYVKSAKKSGRLNCKGGLSLRTVEYHIAILRNALNHAVRLRLIPSNPCEGVVVRSNTKNSSSKHNVYVMTPDELDKILLRVKNTNIYLPTLIANSTGMRLGEVLGLRWKDVNFNNRTISIMQQVKKVRGQLIIGDLKTVGSTRVITVDRKLIQAMKAYKAHQGEKRLLLGAKYNDHDLICAMPDGRPRNPGTVSSRFRRFAQGLNLRISFHDLRHAHATLLLGAGIDPNEIQARLGHHDIAFTLRAYCHSSPSLQYRAADTFEKIMYDRRPTDEAIHRSVSDDNNASVTNL